jgi:predicted O-methyltransferase YrrM
MDDRIRTVLDLYRTRMQEERIRAPRRAAWRPRPMHAGDRGHLLNILACSLLVPTILELGISFGCSSIWLAEEGAQQAER